MAGNLGIHAYVVEGPGRGCGHDRACMGALLRGTVISSLAGRYGPDDQPDKQDGPTDPHSLPPKDGQLLPFRRAVDAKRSCVYPVCDRYTWRAAAIWRGSDVARHNGRPFLAPVYRVC